MRRILLACLFVVTSVHAQPAPKRATTTAVAGPSAFDKAQMEAFVRHLFVWPPPIEITVGDPQPAPIPGFKEIIVRAHQGEAGQDEKFYVSNNGKEILQASIYQVTENPFHDNLTKIHVKGLPSLGVQGAPVEIVEFSDFQCHFCKEEAKVYRDNLKEYPKDVHFYFADFPLDNLHPWAHAAAIAGRCVLRATNGLYTQ